MYVTIIKLMVFILGISMVSAASANADIRPELQQVLINSQQSDLINIIIDFTDSDHFKSLIKQTNSDHSTIIHAAHANSDLSQKQLIQFLRTKNITEFKVLWLINALAVTVEAQLVTELASHIGVARIRFDQEFQINSFTDGVAGTPEWNINQINAPTLWNKVTSDGLGYKGQNAVIGIMDTGVDLKHPELAASYRTGGVSWFDPYFNKATSTTISAPYDLIGHGTSVTGVIVGGNLSGTNIGVAPAAKWIAAKIFNDAGNVVTSAVHRAFQWMLDPDMDPNTNDYPDIVNNSWNSEISVNKCNQEFAEDIRLLKTLGISVVFSSGNSGANLVSSSVSPANNTGTISVGALDESLAVTDFSGKGPSTCDPSDIYPNLVAPGVGIFTTDLTSVSTNGKIVPTYTHQTGTSFSAPHVSGALALLKSAYPGSTAAQRELALSYSAVDLGANGQDNDFGWGYLNISGAFLVMPDIILDQIPLVTLAPVANNDLSIISKNAGVTTISILVNDFADTRVNNNNKLDPASIVILSKPAESLGSVSVNPETGLVRFTPAKDAFGSASITYTVTDSMGNVSNIGTVNINVNGRVAPIAKEKPASSGGCSLQTSAHFDVVFPFLLLLSLLYFIRLTIIKIKSKPYLT